MTLDEVVKHPLVRYQVFATTMLITHKDNYAKMVDLAIRATNETLQRYLDSHELIGVRIGEYNLPQAHQHFDIVYLRTVFSYDIDGYHDYGRKHQYRLFVYYIPKYFVT